MSEKHTNNIIDLYFKDTGYESLTFEEKWQSQYFEISSDLGHTIPVYYLTSNNSYDNKTVVLVHWHESNDLKQVVAFTKEKAENNSVGVLGQSMGSATIGYYLGINEAQENLAFAVMDCPYSGMYDEIVWEISKGKVPPLANAVASLGSIFCKAIYGYSFEDVDIAARIRNSNTPTLILHSKTDQKCPYFMAKKIFQAIPHDNKMLIFYESSEHLFSFWDDPDRYIADRFSFINHYVE